MVNKDWLSVVSGVKMRSFLENRLKLQDFDLEKHQDKKYGTYFTVITKEYAIDPVLYFGRYGKLKVVADKHYDRFEDDFSFLKENPLFMQEYIAFVHSENKLDGTCRRINGKTFLDCFKEEYNNFEASLEENNERGE